MNNEELQVEFSKMEERLKALESRKPSVIYGNFFITEKDVEAALTGRSETPQFYPIYDLAVREAWSLFGTNLFKSKMNMEDFPPQTLLINPITNKMYVIQDQFHVVEYSGTVRQIGFIRV